MRILFEPSLGGGGGMALVWGREPHPEVQTLPALFIYYSLSKKYPFHIPRTKIAPLMYVKNKPKTVDLRPLFLSVMVQERKKLNALHLAGD